jgi:cytochrome P450
MKTTTHHSNTFHRFSTAFIENAAVFTASQEAYLCGDFFKLNLPFITIYVVNDPEIVKHVLVDHEAKYEKSKIYWLELRRVIGKAMGSLEGDEWTVLKQLQKCFFTRPNVSLLMADVVNLTAHGISKLVIEKKIDILSHLSAINLQIILKTIFGVSDGKNATTVAHMIEDGEAFIAWRSKFPWRPFLSVLTPTWIRTQRALKYLSKWSSGIIEDKKFDETSMTHALIQAGYDATHIRNEMIVHLGASTETVAVVESWTLYMLEKHIAYRQKVLIEIETNKESSIFDESQYPFLTAAIKESMRLYPPSHAIVRDCVDVHGDTIHSTRISKGDVMYISAYGIHRSPKYWPNPDDFIPERFLDGADAKIPKYAYLPFGGGKHTCIGKYLAMPMMITAIVMLLRRFDYCFVAKEDKQPISLSTLKSHNGFELILTSKPTHFSTTKSSIV